MKNLLIGSRGDPKSISRKKGSPKCEAPYFHKKSEFRKKEKMTDLIKSYEQQFGNLTAEVMSNNDYVMFLLNIIIPNREHSGTYNFAFTHKNL